MSQAFKLRYNQLREGDPTKPTMHGATHGHEYYETPGHGRNLCLVWPDGKRMFLNYAYLVSGEFTVDGEKNVISLNFSAYTLHLTGYSLEMLFIELFDHIPRLIVAVDERYVSEKNTEEAFVINIIVERKE